jgi:hypothetical protein
MVMWQPQQALRVVEAVVGISAALSTSELLSSRGILASSGVMCWEVNRLRFRWFLHEFWELFFAYKMFVGVLYLRLVCSLIVIFCPHRGVWIAASLVIVAISTIMLAARCPYGLDGSDQMTFLTCISCAVAETRWRDGQVAFTCLWFLTGSVAFCYLISGVAKLTAPGWRSGSSLSGILSTRMYGHPHVYILLKQHPRLAQLLSWTVMGFECLFIVGLFAHPLIATIFIATGLIFHFANAALMGLNTFLFSFLAFYPAVLYCAWSCREILRA